MTDRHVLHWTIFVLMLFGGVGGVFLGSYISSDTIVNDYQLEIATPEGKRVALQYGVWPELANVDFFKKVHDSFVSEKASFVEANLTAMQVHVYQDGQLLFSVPIKSKGKEGSWWETPSGLYRAEGKEENHFSSFGHVFMPWSIPFQGNFFIHGWPYYPDGTPVREGYSGGCIRLEDVYAKQVYEQVKVGTPILVYEDESVHSFSYVLNAPKIEATNYLVADLDTNFVLASGATEVPSKTTLLSKVITAVVASEYKNIEEPITVTSETLLKRASSTRLAVDTTYSLYDFFFPLLLEDSDEVQFAIENHFGKNRFLSLIQTKAKALGMHETVFTHSDKGLLSDTTTAHDIFLFLKYLHTNRPFILNMSANKTDTRTYGEPIFTNLAPVHPLISHSLFKGGVANAKKETFVQEAEQSQEASVALAFAQSNSSTQGATEDLISVFTLPFNGEERMVAFIVLDSSNPANDTKELLGFVQQMYK